MTLKGNFFYKRLGENIFSERSRKKISQEQLGSLCDTDRTYIARIEEGKANPTIRALHKISRGLKVRLSKLLKGV